MKYFKQAIIYFLIYNIDISRIMKGEQFMDKEIIYKRSRKDIAIYLILSIIGDLGAIYAIQVNSLIVGLDRKSVV